MIRFYFYKSTGLVLCCCYTGSDCVILENEGFDTTGWTSASYCSLWLCSYEVVVGSTDRPTAPETACWIPHDLGFIIDRTSCGHEFFSLLKPAFLKAGDLFKNYPTVG